MLRVGIYCRISVDRLGRAEGVAAQEKWGREYCAERWPGATIVVYADNDLSAAKDDVHRPGYERLRDDIREGRLDHVWTVEQYRLERREVPWFQLAAELAAAGIEELHTNRDGIVRVLDEVAGIKAVLGAAEVRRLRKRINDTLAVNVERGRPPGAPVFGYRHCKDSCTHGGGKTLHVIPEQAEAIQWAADAILTGWSLTSIADELNRRGLRGATGGRIRTTSVRSILTSGTIAGRRIHQGADAGTGNWEPILPIDVWQAVRARLAGPRKVKMQNCGGREYVVGEGTFSANRASARTGRLYVLTGGLTVCGVCGAPLAGARVKRADNVKARYLRCTPSRGGRSCVGISMDDVERVVFDELFAELERPEFLADITADDHAARRAELLAEIAAAEGKRRGASRRWATDEITDPEWAEIRAHLDERERAALAALAELPASPEKTIDIDTVRELWDDPEGLTLDERRAFVRRYIERVTIHRSARGRGSRPFDRSRVEIKFRDKARTAAVAEAGK